MHGFSGFLIKLYQEYITERNECPKETPITFCKATCSRSGKIAISKSIGEYAAAQVYSQLLFRNILEISNLRKIDRWVLSSNKSDEPWFYNKIKTLGWQTSYQSEGDIGERMLEALTRFLSRGRLP